MARYKGSKHAAAQKKPPLTHFLCIPLITPTSKPQLESALSQFRDETTTSSPKMHREIDAAVDETGEVTLPSIPSKAFRPLGSLHFTLGVMSLDKDQLSEAVECLQGSEVRDLVSRMCSTSAKSSTLQESKSPIQLSDAIRPLSIDVKGLASMHNPRQTSILYCPPEDPTVRLYPLCVALQALFKDKGFIIEDNRALKLHATLVNMIYAKGDRSAGHGPNARAPLKLDATNLLEKYKDYVWAENVVLDRLAICEMGAKKKHDDKGAEIDAEYTEVATISLPT